MLTDTDALTEIHHMLDGKEWTVEMLEWIAEIVAKTGRRISPPEI